MVSPERTECTAVESTPSQTKDPPESFCSANPALRHRAHLLHLRTPSTAPDTNRQIAKLCRTDCYDPGDSKEPHTAGPLLSCHPQKAGWAPSPRRHVCNACSKKDPPTKIVKALGSTCRTPAPRALPAFLFPCNAAHTSDKSCALAA